LQKEGRALVGEGILMKVCRKKPKQRAFFLFNDILVYGRVVISGRKVKDQGLFNKRFYYILLFSIHNKNSFHLMKSKSVLQLILLVNIYIDQMNFIYILYIENPFAWLISSPKKSFVVRANSDRERQEWLTHLDRCIRYVSGI